MGQPFSKHRNKKEDGETSPLARHNSHPPIPNYTTASGSSGWNEEAQQGNDYRLQDLSTFPISVWEHAARLSRLNPLVFQWNSTIGIMALFDQMSRLYPTERTYVLPTGAMLSIISGGIGFYMGLEALQHSNKEPLSNTKSRAWTVLIDGFCFILPFGLNEAGQYGLQIYCANAPSTEPCFISDAKFWGQLFPVPLALTMAYMGWNNISPHQQFLWQLQDRLSWKKWPVKIFNFISEAFLASRTIQMLASEAGPSQMLSAEYAAIAGSIFSVVSRTMKPQYRERIQALLTHARSAALWIYFYRFLKAEFLNPENTFEETSDPWIFATLTASSGLFFLVGSVLIYLYHQEYFKHRQRLHSTLMPGATLSENQFYDNTHSQSTLQAIVDNPEISKANKQKVNQNVQAQVMRLTSILEDLNKKAEINTEKDQEQLQIIARQNNMIECLTAELEALQKQLALFNVDLTTTDDINTTNAVPPPILMNPLKHSSTPAQIALLCASNNNTPVTLDSKDPRKLSVFKK